MWGWGLGCGWFKRQVDRGDEAWDGSSPLGAPKAVRTDAIGSEMTKEYIKAVKRVF